MCTSALKALAPNRCRASSFAWIIILCPVVLFGFWEAVLGVEWWVREFGGAEAVAGLEKRGDMHRLLERRAARSYPLPLEDRRAARWRGLAL